MAGLPISIGSVGVRIVPDMRGFVEDVSAHMRTIPDVTVNVHAEIADALLKLTEVQGLVDHLSGETARVNVDVNHAALADGQLALFDLEDASVAASGAMTALSASVDEMVAAVDDVGANIDVAVGALDDVAATTESAGAGAATAIPSFTLLGAAIAGVVLLAGPIVAVLTPALFGLAGVVASLAAGFGVFALAIGPVVKAVQAFHKEQLDPTTANMQALQRSLVGMPGAGRGLVLFLGTTLWNAFDRLQRAAEKGLFPGLLKGIQAAMPLITPLTRFVGSLAKVLGNLAAQAGKALNDKFWRGFFRFITSQAGPVLKTFGQIVGNLAHGFAAMFEGFGPIALKIGQGIESLSRSFAKWSSGKGFQDFLAYVNKNGPIFAKLLGDIVVIAAKLIIALVPLGTLLVKLVTPIANFLASLSPNELLAIVAGLGAMVGGFFGLAAAIVATAALIVNNWKPIKGFFEAIGRWFSGPFVRFFVTMGHDITRGLADVGGFFVSIWDHIKGIAESVGRWFSGPFVHFFEDVWHGIKTAFDKVIQFLTSLPGKIKEFFKDAGTWLLDAGKKIIGGLWDGMKGAFGGVLHKLHGLVSKLEFWKGSPSLHEMAPTLLAGTGETIVKGLGDGIKHGWPSVVDVLHTAGGSIPQSLAQGITAGTPHVTAAMQGLNAALSKEISNLKSQLSSLQSSKSSLAQSISSSLAGFDLTQAGTQVTSTTGGTPSFYSFPGEGSGFYVPPSTSTTSTQYTAAGLKNYLDTYLAQEDDVLRLLGKLSHGKHPLTNAEITMFEEMPVAQADPILRALAQGTQGQIGGILADIRDINRTGAQAGKGHAQQVYDPQIKELKAEIHALRGDVQHVGGDTAAALNNTVAGAQRRGTARAAH